MASCYLQEPEQKFNESLELKVKESKATEDPYTRQNRLRKAFQHACQWYIKENDSDDNKLRFLNRILGQIFSIDGTFGKFPPLHGGELENFLEEFATTPPEARVIAIRQFIQNIRISNQDIEIAQLKATVKELQNENIKLKKRIPEDAISIGSSSSSSPGIFSR